MKTLRHILILSALVLSLFAPLPIRGEKNKEISLSSVVEAVTVYRDRALVTRVCRLDFQPGIHALKIANLPILLSDESVRVSGSGSAAAKILDIKIKSERLEESASGRISELEKSQRELKDQIQILNDRMELLSRKDEFLRSLLKSGSGSQEQELQKKGIGEWSRMIDFLEVNLDRLLGEKRGLEAEKAKLLDKKGVIDHELGQQIEMRTKERKSIALEIEVSRGGGLKLEASYIVPQVSWTPIYDLRFSPDKREAALTCQALVRQETGEDWEGTALTLSTARPLMENSLPELSPQTLDRPHSLAMAGSNIIFGKVILEDGSEIPGATLTLAGGEPMGSKTTVSQEDGSFRFSDLLPGTYQLRCQLEGFRTSIHQNIQLAPGQNLSITLPMLMSTLQEEIVVAGQAPLIDTKSSDRSFSFKRNRIAASSAGSSGKGRSGADVIEKPLIQKMEVPTAGISAHTVAATFALKQKETILSNNTPQKVTMAIETIPFQREYLAIPKIVELSFMKATLTNAAQFPLLPGKVSIFYDESFVASAAIPQVSANEKFALSIGEMSGIKVKQERIEKKSDSSGFLSKKLQTVFEYRITVENFHKSEESITVIDQIPVSENKDITVELLNISPAPLKPAEEEAEREKKEGTLKWLLRLKPLEKKSIVFKYAVTHPKKLEIYNLD